MRKGRVCRYPWVGPACADLANACRIASDVRAWGNGTFGTAKAVNLMAKYGGNYSVAGTWCGTHLLGTVAFHAKNHD